MTVFLLALDISAVVLVVGIYYTVPAARWLRKQINKTRHEIDHIT